MIVASHLAVILSSCQGTFAQFVVRSNAEPASIERERVRETREWERDSERGKARYVTPRIARISTHTESCEPPYREERRWREGQQKTRRVRGAEAALADEFFFPVARRNALFIALASRHILAHTYSPG